MKTPLNIRLLKAVLRQDFKAFVRKVFAEVSPGTVYMDNWHIDVICAELEAILRGENNRLIVNIPPRYMKSIICSVALPAYILGHFPDESVICVSYADELSKKMAADCRRVMESEWYKRIFPFTRLAPSRREVMDFETTRGGGRYSSTVGGTLTGRGGNWLIIDDPIKPSDVNSDLIRNKVNDWYGNTLYSRLNDKKNGKILVIMQRTHEQDLTGYLLESKAGFKQIRMPLVAITDEKWTCYKQLGRRKWRFYYQRATGEPLHPAREGLPEIERVKASMGGMAFSCQCQQDPLAPGGNIVKWEWFRTYEWEKLQYAVEYEGLALLQVVFSFDLALRTGRENDYSVCVCALRSAERYYVVDVKRWKLELPDLVKAAWEHIQALHKKCRTIERKLEVRILVEDVGCGVGFSDAIKKMGFYIDKIHPQDDKVTRLKNVTPVLERGTCLLPKIPPAWLGDFKHEILGFPNTKHDDQVDALSQLLEFKQPKRFDWA